MTNPEQPMSDQRLPFNELSVVFPLLSICFFWQPRFKKRL